MYIITILPKCVCIDRPMFPFVASRIGIESKLIEPFEVATPVGDFVIATRVYKNCSVAIYSLHTVADLIELNMIEFDIIIGMVG